MHAIPALYISRGGAQCDVYVPRSEKRQNAWRNNTSKRQGTLIPETSAYVTKGLSRAVSEDEGGRNLLVACLSPLIIDLRPLSRGGGEKYLPSCIALAV